MTYISRGPFARQELHKRSVPAASGCNFCGSTRNGAKLFQYYVETDGGRKSDIRGLFCSIGCMRAYHGN